MIGAHQVTNPYAAPASRIDAGRAVKGSAVKAIVVGALVDIGGSVAASILLMLAYGLVLAANGESFEAIESLGGLRPDSWPWIASSAIGLGFSVLGGYACARIARHRELLLGAILAVISTSFGLLVGASYYSAAVNFLLAAGSVASIMAGAWFGRLRNVRGR
jgi:hypothetical protein